jgi:hypothetical protein
MHDEHEAPRANFFRGLTALIGKIVPTESRRTSVRFVVPGATIKFEASNPRRNGNGISSNERYPVLELSKGGMSFLADQHLSIHSKVSVFFSLPDNESEIRLIGRVVYCVPRGVGHDYRYRVGMQFSQFGAGKGCNSMGSLEVLESLETSCQSVEDEDF